MADRYSMISEMNCALVNVCVSHKLYKNNNLGVKDTTHPVKFFYISCKKQSLMNSSQPNSSFKICKCFVALIWFNIFSHNTQYRKLH